MVPYGGVVLTEDGQVNLEDVKVSPQLAWGPGLCFAGRQGHKPASQPAQYRRARRVAAIALGFNGEANISGGST